jgi:hypothetical protein
LSFLFPRFSLSCSLFPSRRRRFLGLLSLGNQYQHALREETTTKKTIRDELLFGSSWPPNCPSYFLFLISYFLFLISYIGPSSPSSLSAHSPPPRSVPFLCPYDGYRSKILRLQFPLVLLDTAALFLYLQCTHTPICPSDPIHSRTHACHTGVQLSCARLFDLLLPPPVLVLGASRSHLLPLSRFFFFFSFCRHSSLACLSFFFLFPIFVPHLMFLVSQIWISFPSVVLSRPLSSPPCLLAPF